MTTNSFRAKGHRIHLVIAGSMAQYRHWQERVATREAALNSRYIERPHQLHGYDPDAVLVVFYGTYMDNPVMGDPTHLWQRYPYEYCRDRR